MASIPFIAFVILVSCSLEVLAGWGSTDEGDVRVSDLDSSALLARFTKACLERCMQRMRNKERCTLFCEFVPHLIEEHFEDVQRLPLTAQEMDWVIYDMASWGILHAQDGTELTPHLLSMKFLLNCREMVDVYYETVTDL